MQAYDLAFGTTPDDLWASPATIGTAPAGRVVLDNPVHVGWFGTRGPRLGASWPRGPLTGLPMMHSLTIVLPPDYRRRGPGYPAISFFQGEGQMAEEGRAGELIAGEEPTPDDLADPFLVSVVEYTRSRHPQEEILTDLIDGRFALFWLTWDEFAAGPSTPPPDLRRPGTHLSDDEGPNAWDDVDGARIVPARIWAAPRPGDPNAGVVPGGAGYVDAYDPQTHSLQPWVPNPLRCHLGGTAVPVQGLPEGMTPWYLELEELPGLNFGGGSCRIDLESGFFDWDCG